MGVVCGNAVVGRRVHVQTCALTMGHETHATSRDHPHATTHRHVSLLLIRQSGMSHGDKRISELEESLRGTAKMARKAQALAVSTLVIELASIIISAGYCGRRNEVHA